MTTGCRLNQPTHEEIIEGISSSKFFVFAVGPGELLHPMVCLQVGAAVMLDKPIIIIAHPQVELPANIIKAAKVVHRADLADPKQCANAQAAVNEYVRNGFSTKPGLVIIIRSKLK